MSESIYKSRALAWRPPQDVAGFCKGHRPSKKAYRYPAVQYGPPLPKHMQEERSEASRQRLIKAMAAKGYRLTFEKM